MHAALSVAVLVLFAGFAVLLSFAARDATGTPMSAALAKQRELNLHDCERTELKQIAPKVWMYVFKCIDGGYTYLEDEK